MFHGNDSPLVVHLEYLLVKKELAFMITKTLFRCCYSVNCDQSVDSFQHNIMDYIIALTNHSLSKETLSEQTNIISHY